MAGSVNKVIMVGNLGKDPEIRSLNNGDRVANLSLATSETWRDKSTGERKEKTEWHRVVIFNEGRSPRRGASQVETPRGSRLRSCRRPGRPQAAAWSKDRRG